MSVTEYVPELLYGCVGFVAEDVGEPSPKFHVKTGEPLVVLENTTFCGPQPVVMFEEKFTCGDGLTAIEMVVSSTHEPADVVSVTWKFPADENKCVGCVAEEEGEPSPKFQVYPVLADPFPVDKFAK